MANIKLIREYTLGKNGTRYYADIVYESGITRTVATSEMPKTARKWRKDARSRVHYDPVYNRHEVVYEPNTWKNQKLDYMRCLFGAKAEEWGDKYHDDRRVYVNTYNMIIKAIESLDDEPNIYVCVAVNHHINEDTERMKRILKKFEGR